MKSHLKRPSAFFGTLSLLWVWIISMQWVSYTEPLLYEETTAAITAALAITAVIELLVFINRGIRMLLQLPLIVFAVYRVLEHYGNPVPSGILGGNGKLADELQYLLPYLWFALAAWAIYLFVSLWVNSKAKILLVTGLNIIAFAILDSFTAVVLWDEIAWVAGAGMGWLVTEHFNRFRIRFPQGWQRLKEYPFKIVANILVIFSLVILAGINMPDIRPSLTDPYTAWREWNGMPLTGSAAGSGGGGILDLPGGSTSGYGREDNNLGGGFNFDYTPVMRVTSEVRSYWRGETRSLYSGSGWADRQGRSDTEAIEPGEELASDKPSGITTKTVQQSVTMLNDNVYPVLFGAYSIASVEQLDSEVDSSALRWKEEGAELHLEEESSESAYPKTYTINSEIPIIPFEELESMPDTWDVSALQSADDETRQYLQIPSDFPERVTNLAQEVTAPGETPYEKVMLLQQYLHNNFSYTNSPDLSKRKSDDFVDSFLFEVKEGYCDYFSTSMVMMSRSIGIPARWVKGYAPGSQQSEEYMNPNSEYIPPTSYTVTNADAHSWAEVYFGEEYGWVPIEATPGFLMPTLAADDQDAQEEPEQQEEEPQEAEQDPAAAATEETSSGSWGRILSIAAGIVILLWIGYIVWRNRFSLRFLFIRLRRGQPLTPADKVIAETERWLRYARRKGLKRGPHETLRESVARWSGENPELAEVLKPLLQRFESARYSPVHVQEEEWRRVHSDVSRLKKSVNRSKSA